MKKLVFVLSAFLSFNTNAEIITGDKCGDDCTWSFDTNTGQLTISGTGAMYNYEYLNQQSEDGDNCFRPYYTIKNNVTSIKIEEGISAVGLNAFFDFRGVEEVSLPQSLDIIQPGGFQSCIALENINLPDNLKTIGYYGITGTALSSIVIPENTSLDRHAFGAEGWAKPFDTAYCANEQCVSQFSLWEDDVTVIIYEKKDGLFVLTDENGVKSYYKTSSDMQNKSNICQDVNLCKAEVLKSKNLCYDVLSDCAALVASADGGNMLKVGSKTYQSLDALLRGNYDRRRIYTIEEANFVAGDKNRVSITYR